ncbi:MAG: HupE/UreJ family protein [Cytophagaceae bacterium]
MTGYWNFFVLGLSNLAFFHLFEHILFITALCGIYNFASWKRVLLFIFLFTTAFQVSFLLSAFNYISAPENLIKSLMPVTILSVAISNLFLKKQAFTNKYPSQNYRFFLAVAAGLIHGFAFPESLQNYLLSPDDQVMELVFFDFGIITGIGITVFFLLLICFILTYFLRVNIREWNLLLSGACAGIAVYIVANYLLVP